MPQVRPSFGLTCDHIDLFNTYTWHPNWGNPATLDGGAFVYDGLGRMVENTISAGTRQYLYAQGGSQVLAQMNGQTPVTVQYPLPGGGMAMYNSSATLTYARPDWLGSARLVTNSTQSLGNDSAYAPFGEQYATKNIGFSGFYDFTGQQQWTVSGGTAALDDFLFRKYHPGQGRWISPDPAGQAAVDITNPQTWNRYAYLANNPLAKIDPLGLYGCLDAPFGPGCDDASGWGGGGGGGGGYGGGVGTDPCGSYCAPPTSLLGNLNAAEEAFGNQLYAQFALNAALNLASFVLNGDNACSSWLNGYAADFMYPGLQGDVLQNKAAAMLQSDSFELNNNNPFTRDLGTAPQGTGWWSVMTFNVNSPFTLASVPMGFPSAGVVTLQGPTFASNSLFGQTTAVFHEFAHTINAIPPDGGNPAQSHTNTGTVLSNCGSAISGS